LRGSGLSLGLRSLAHKGHTKKRFLKPKSRLSDTPWG
jgi:hypothetical protein